MTTPLYNWLCHVSRDLNKRQNNNDMQFFDDYIQMGAGCGSPKNHTDERNADRQSKAIKILSEYLAEHGITVESYDFYWETDLIPNNHADPRTFYRYYINAHFHTESDLLAAKIVLYE